MARQYPTIASAATEIINLQAILSLPKGTEHFMTDIHGEYEQFQHILKNGSGAIKRKIQDEFGNAFSEAEKKSIATLIYYPELKLEQVQQSEEDLEDWYSVMLYRLICVCKNASSKYTRSKVRKALPKDFAYVIEELLNGRPDVSDQEAYYNEIIHSVIRTGRAPELIIALCNLIRRLVVDHLHVVGDIFDRGPYPHMIMDSLMEHHSVDIQWGNHDVLWMGAAAGNTACIANVLRISAKYGNLNILEDGYGINLVPLARLAMTQYADDPCKCFSLDFREEEYDVRDAMLDEKMHKAISIIQFKEEARIFKRRPEWKMQDRCLFNNVDYERGICTIDGKEYEMTCNHFPTVDPNNPDSLTPEEEQLMKRLHHSFTVSEKLRKHIRTLLSHGCMYAIYNSNLLFHASIPLNSDGTLKEVELYKGKKYSGLQLMLNTGMLIRSAFESDTELEERSYAIDYFLYLWCGKDSPLFDKSKMATFERYFLKDRETYKEEKGNYFKLRDNEEICDRILDAFNVTGPNRHIINGHVPVHASNGENPIKANGKLMVIDGGFSEAYHKETGIAGYTLVYHSRGFQLVQHEPFTSAADSIQRGTDIKSTTQIVEMSTHRMLVADTDKGAELRAQISDLKELLYAYRHGIIKEKR